MTPNLNKPGHSFLGAMRYYMHDKRPDGETGPHPTTAERVEWTETRNLGAANGPQDAARIMISHAQQADELKQAHGIASSGRKSKAHVHTFSLSWKAGEVDGLDRTEMLRATDAALKFLGADHLQAIIIAHNDTEHPHVHVMVNRVQADGTMWNPSHSKNKFQQWANRYEHENGKIVSPKRAEKWDKIEEARAQHPAAEDRRRYVEALKAEREKQRQARAAEAQQKPADRPDQDATKPRQESDQAKPKSPSPGQILKDRADAQKARHKAEWKAWGDTARRERQAIYRQADTARSATDAAFKEATRADWGAHFKDERDRRRNFDKRERAGFFGIVRNAIDAARIQIRLADSDRAPGLFGQTVRNVFSAKARREGLDAYLSGRGERFRAWMGARRDMARQMTDAQKRAALSEHDRKVQASRDELAARHALEQGQMREAWSQHYAAKAAAPEQRWRRTGPRPYQKPPAADHVATAKHSFSRHAGAPQPAAAPAERTNAMGIRRTWEQLQEDRAIMSGAAPTNTENMQRRDEDAAAAGPTPGESWIAKYRRAAEQRAAGPSAPKPKPRGPRMKF